MRGFSSSILESRSMVPVVKEEFYRPRKSGIHSMFYLTKEVEDLLMKGEDPKSLSY